MKKTNKTLVLLNFNDPNNPWKDECNRNWTTHGNPKLIYDLSIGRYVASFDRTKREGLILNEPLVLGGKNFTIDGIYYMDSSTTWASRLFEFNVVIGESSKMELCYGTLNTQHTLRIRINTTSGADKVFESIYFPNNQYVHFAISYNWSTKSIVLFANGIQGISGTYIINRTTFPYVSIATSIPHNYNDSLTGKIQYFRIEEDLLFTENFNPKYKIEEFNYSLKKTFELKRNIWHLYTIPYDIELYYNTNTIRYNDTLRNVVVMYETNRNIKNNDVIIDYKAFIKG